MIVRAIRKGQRGNWSYHVSFLHVPDKDVFQGGDICNLAIVYRIRRNAANQTKCLLGSQNNIPRLAGVVPVLGRGEDNSEP